MAGSAEPDTKIKSAIEKGVATLLEKNLLHKELTFFIPAPPGNMIPMPVAATVSEAKVFTVVWVQGAIRY